MLQTKGMGKRLKEVQQMIVDHKAIPDKFQCTCIVVVHLSHSHFVDRNKIVYIYQLCNATRNSR